MKVVFRCDASLQIGTGHVMRCLTLADELRARGAECHFVTRAQAGNLISHIESKGYNAHVLPVTEARDLACDQAQLAHAGWLGATQAQDLAACLPILASLHPSCVIVDHYALDVQWERTVRSSSQLLVAIDDLADRVHVCDVLIDQTFGRDPHDYKPWVPPSSTLLCGTHYALLRPEFRTLRPYSLKRRQNPQRIQRLLITMGGVDLDNVTEGVLTELAQCSLPSDCLITVVMGGSSPWLEQVRNKALQMQWPTRVLVSVNNMAELMAESDAAVGAAGSTSWERCCLGLPTIQVVLAANQRKIAKELEQTGAAICMELPTAAGHDLASLIATLNTPKRLTEMSAAASHVADGKGVERVAALILQQLPS